MSSDIAAMFNKQHKLKRLLCTDYFYFKGEGGGIASTKEAMHAHILCQFNSAVVGPSVRCLS